MYWHHVRMYQLDRRFGPWTFSLRCFSLGHFGLSFLSVEHFCRMTFGLKIYKSSAQLLSFAEKVFTVLRGGQGLHCTSFPLPFRLDHHFPTPFILPPVPEHIPRFLYFSLPVSRAIHHSSKSPQTSFQTPSTTDSHPSNPPYPYLSTVIKISSKAHLFD